MSLLGLFISKQFGEVVRQDKDDEAMVQPVKSQQSRKGFAGLWYSFQVLSSSGFLAFVIFTSP